MVMHPITNRSVRESKGYLPLSQFSAIELYAESLHWYYSLHIFDFHLFILFIHTDSYYSHMRFLRTQNYKRQEPVLSNYQHYTWLVVSEVGSLVRVSHDVDNSPLRSPIHQGMRGRIPHGGRATVWSQSLETGWLSRLCEKCGRQVERGGEHILTVVLRSD
jgi:hypothetical protein